MDSPLPPPLTPGAARLIKIRGWLLVIIGPSLSVSMALLISFLAQVIHHDPADAHLSHWNGSRELTAWAFNLFRAIFVFGVVALGCGLSLLRRGRIGAVLGVLFALSLAAICWYGYQILSNAHPA